MSLCCGLSLAGSQAVTLVAMTTIHGPCQPLYSCAVSAIASPPPHVHTYMYIHTCTYIHTYIVCIYAHVQRFCFSSGDEEV